MKGNFWENLFMAISITALLISTCFAVFATGACLAETAPSAWSGSYAVALYLIMLCGMVCIARRG